jgi:hypothetical protein
LQVKYFATGNLQPVTNPLFSHFMDLLVIFTNLLQPAFPAFRIAGQADVSSMQDQPVMGFVDQFFWDVFDQLQLCLQGCFCTSG